MDVEEAFLEKFGKKDSFFEEKKLEKNENQDIIFFFLKRWIDNLMRKDDKETVRLPVIYLQRLEMNSIRIFILKFNTGRSTGA